MAFPCANCPSASHEPAVLSRGLGLASLGPCKVLFLKMGVWENAKVGEMERNELGHDM